MNNAPVYTIEQGIKPEHREDAARLYAEAFAKKFEKLIGSPEEVTEVLKVMGKLDRHIGQTSEPPKYGIYLSLQFKFAEKNSRDNKTIKKQRVI